MKKINIRSILKKHKIKILLGLFFGLVILTLNKNKEKFSLSNASKVKKGDAPCLEGQCGEVKKDVNGNETNARCSDEFPIFLGNCETVKKSFEHLPKKMRPLVLYGENCDCSACPSSGDKDNPVQKWDPKQQKCVKIPCDEDCNCRFSKRVTKAANSNYKKCKKNPKLPECKQQQKPDNKCK